MGHRIRGDHVARILDDGRPHAKSIRFRLTSDSLSGLIGRLRDGLAPDSTITAVMEPIGMSWFPVARWLEQAGVKVIRVKGQRVRCHPPVWRRGDRSGVCAGCRAARASASEAPARASRGRAEFYQASTSRPGDLGIADQPHFGRPSHSTRPEDALDDRTIVFRALQALQPAAQRAGQVRLLLCAIMLRLVA